MHSLPVFIRLQDRKVALIGSGEAADAKRRLLMRAGARIVTEAEAVSLAIVADGDASVAARLKARGVLVNVVDRPDLCDFTLPAIVDRSPVIVAVGTGGASAGLAKALRQRLEALLPASLGALADGLAAARGAMRNRWPDTIERRRALESGFESGGPLDPLGDRHDIEAWLADPVSTQSVSVTITLRSTDPEDLTLREARLLGEADRIFYRPGVPSVILDRARADTVRVAGVKPQNVLPGLTIELDLA